jgi:hypothetical protein
VDVTPEDFRRHYESLSDEALLEIDPTELVDLARNCHAVEVARRGLAEDSSGAADATPLPDSQAAEKEKEELVCIVEYDTLDEADLARGLLEAAEIPATTESEPGVVRLMVPAALANQALGMLASPLSDEELAAQAEAAGYEDEEPQEPDADVDEGRPQAG